MWGRSRLLRAWQVAAWGVVALVTLVHFYYVIRYAVNVPSWDEWDQLAANSLARELNWEWLFRFHSEHRIVWTNLQTWLLYRIDGWDSRTQVALNFVLYGAIGYLIHRYKNATVRDFPAWPLFFIPWMSAHAWQNHSWGFQSQFHFVLFFPLLAVLFIFRESASPARWFCGALFVVAMFYSFSSGVPGGCAFMFTATLFAVGRGAYSGQWKRALQELAVSLPPAGLALYFWFHGYIKPANHPPYAFPTALPFWKYLLHLISSGFGFNGAWDFPIAIAMLLLGFGSALWLFCRRATRWSPALWGWLALQLTIIAMLSAVSIGRAGFGMDRNVASRYREISAVLMFSTLILGVLALQDYQARIRDAFPFALLAFLFIGYSGQFNYLVVYRHVQDVRQGELACVRAFFQGKGNGQCPPNLGVDRYRRAQQLRVSFTREP